MYRENKILLYIGSSPIPLANARGSENLVQVQFRLLTRAALKIWFNAIPLANTRGSAAFNLSRAR